MIKEKKRTTCFSYIYIYMKYLNFLLPEISSIYIYILHSFQFSYNEFAKFSKNIQAT